MSRPEALFPLFADLETLDGVGPKSAALFHSLGVARPKDLLFLLPQAGVDRQRRSSIRDVIPPAVVTVEVEVGIHMPPRTKGKPYRVFVNDELTEFQLVFFHARAPYLETLLPIGSRRLLSGRVEVFDHIAQMVHPDHVLDLAQAGNLPPYEPVYPLTAGLNQKTLIRAVGAALKRAPLLEEWIDPALKARENWPNWADALAHAHAPKQDADLGSSAPARQRLAYDEFFAHQVTLALARVNFRRVKGRVTLATGDLQASVFKILPYQPTSAQTRAIADITKDLAAPERMNRLLQGDVGAGKTLVAFMAMLGAIEGGGQAVLMAPTEILACQHFESLQSMAQAAGVEIALLTGRDKGAERATKLSRLVLGHIGLLIGTHAVFQKDVHFADLRLAVVDEQHRFGVAQRMELGAKGRAVDVLVMTATPIPRSLALAGYGDMDISVLDEKPVGRKPVTTVLVADSRIDEVVAHLARAVREGKQAYWVCPLVEDSEILDYISAEARFVMLRASFGEDVVGLVHGQMPPADKDAAMARFVAGKTLVLVATTVIEVGVNVPNASIIVVERAEKFGLAQLHQLRGRVGRGDAQSTCLLLYKAPLTTTGERRLAILRKTEDGFSIAEEDLSMRGAGDLIGTAQSGLPRFRIANVEDQASLMQIAHQDARTLLTNDPDLSSPRGHALRYLLWLLDHDRAIRLIGVG
ncbi:MAG: ATP-dependent DNA helicase RecG [Paracoccaceae bacterium]|jgi:ATP-dependent DNA helicase RecG